MPEYSEAYSKRKMTAVQAMVAEVKKIEILKKQGGKKLLAEHGYRGNQPKMALRGLRSFLLSEDKLFADLLEQYESGKRTAYKLAEGIRQRTEKIGQDEVIIHSDTIHHPEPLELGDGLLEMEPRELSDFLTEQYETKGKTFGDTKESVRGQSYTTRGHLNQATNPRGRYKATNEFSEPGRTDISAHPRGPNDPLMKAPDVKPTNRAEANAFVETIEPLTKESVELGSYADKDVRALADQKVTERGIIKPGDTLYRSDLPDETLKLAQDSLNNVADEIDLAKAFKTPRARMENGVLRLFFAGKVPKVDLAGAGLGALQEAYNMETIGKIEEGDYSGAADDVGRGVIAGAAIETATKALGPGATKALGKVVAPVAAFGLASQGRDGSTTKYLADTYGEKVGMNQNRPSWGTEFGEMNTEKPGYVQATEDAFDYLGEKTTQAVNGVINFTKKLGTRPANSDFTTL